MLEESSGGGSQSARLDEGGAEEFLGFLGELVEFGIGEVYLVFVDRVINLLARTPEERRTTSHQNIGNHTCRPHVYLLIILKLLCEFWSHIQGTSKDFGEHVSIVVFLKEASESKVGDFQTQIVFIRGDHEHILWLDVPTSVNRNQVKRVDLLTCVEYCFDACS